MSSIELNGNVDLWHEGEGATDIGNIGEDAGTQDYWDMGSPVGYLYVGGNEQIKPFAFAVMIGF